MRLHAFITFIGILVSISCCLANKEPPATSKPAGSNHSSQQIRTPEQTTTNEKTAKPSVPTTSESGKGPKSAATASKPTQTSKPTTPTKITKPTPTAHKKTEKTQKPVSTKTSKLEIRCELRNESCSKCIKGPNCFYCNSDKSCRKKNGVLPTGCKGNKWYWKQCNILGNILIIVFPTVGGVLLIMLGCCIYCCCCRRCGKNSTAREERRQQQRREDRGERNAERKQNRKARHDAIRMKYGLLQNMDEDDDPVA